MHEAGYYSPWYSKLALQISVGLARKENVMISVEMIVKADNRRMKRKIMKVQGKFFYAFIAELWVLYINYNMFPYTQLLKNKACWRQANIAKASFS